MKFVVDFVTKHSGRMGTLSKGDIEIKTPLALHYTKVASVPHISREVFDLLTTEQQAIQVSIETTSTLADAVHQFQKGIAAFAALGHTFTLATLKDTGTVITSPQYSRNAVEIVTRAGKLSITPQKYISVLESFKPDIFHALCDGDTSETCAIKRIFNAVTRTDTFFKECAALYKQSTILADAMFIAPVEGGYNEEYRQRSIKLLNDYENQEIIGGYFLDGFHSSGETAKQLDALKVCKIVEKCAAMLPVNKIKIMLGAYSPTLVIQLIQLGVDVFDTTYAYLSTSINQALTFTFDVNCSTNELVPPFAIDLSDPIYKDQFKPYVKGCECLACRNHTRAYTQHLVHTKELLAPILLMIHNTHHYLEFFKAIRQHNTNDTLSTLLTLIHEQQIKYDAAQRLTEKQSGPNESSVSANSNSSPFKKLKNVANEVE